MFVIIHNFLCGLIDLLLFISAVWLLLNWSLLRIQMPLL